MCSPQNDFIIEIGVERKSVFCVWLVKVLQKSYTNQLITDIYFKIDKKISIPARFL